MGVADSLARVFRKMVYAHLPFTYKHLSHEKVGHTVAYILAVVALALLLTVASFVPAVWNIQEYIDYQASKFDSFKLNGQVVQSDPIYMPENDPQVVIDASGKEPYGGETLKLTADYLYFHLSNKPKRIKVSNLLNPKEHEKEFTAFLFAVVLFALPSILFYLYLFLLLKYLLIIVVSALVLFSVVRIILLIKISLLRTFNIAAYAATPMILIEVISTPFNPKYLFPVFKYGGLTLYATTTLIFLIFLITGFLLVEDYVISSFVEEREELSKVMPPKMEETKKRA